MTLTALEFRARHGDPATWCAAEIDSYFAYAEITPVAPLYAHGEMQAIAADFEASADQQAAVADRLAADGHETAAGIWRRGAAEARELAAAARVGWPHYEVVLNGW
ncbi:hypothetical protein [Streptomyces sp. V1I6]|uniref:hypothetical protein n=1 Tax=Streptomyces sp. V1I6 TaxID=3042273 RepID=UPI00278A025F|nr:hypothetical protein [Streptomyces sp. V1I6]MDQ0847581.1 hypothetical protein [Streptomyces sp. V1I6]